MRELKGPEQPVNPEKNPKKKWYKATVILAHNGSGSRDEAIVFIFANDAADAFRQLHHNKGGIKRKRTPEKIIECTAEEISRLIEEIMARNMNLSLAQRRGLKSVAPGELEVF